MSETKFTPGPWECDEDACFICQNGDVLKIVGQVRGWGWLSKKYGDKKAFEIQKANGKLLAAAPDLLEALQSVLALIDNGTLVRNISKDSEPDYAVRQLLLILAIKQASEAIKKATS